MIDRFRKFKETGSCHQCGTIHEAIMDNVTGEVVMKFDHLRPNFSIEYIAYVMNKATEFVAATPKQDPPVDQLKQTSENMYVTESTAKKVLARVMETLAKVLVEWAELGNQVPDLFDRMDRYGEFLGKDAELDGLLGEQLEDQGCDPGKIHILVDQGRSLWSSRNAKAGR